MPLAQALEEARKRELDLVLTVPQAQPPVVQLVEYKLFLWELSKREKAAAKALREQQRRGRPKEVRITLQASPHDRDIKIQQARGLLESGHVVRLMVMARLRDMGAAQDLLRELAESLGEVGALSEGQAAFVPGKNNVACTVHPSKARSKRPALQQAKAVEMA
ncbi:hypothetical protein H632_c583p0 [Helicosporidium sp. ATCC 50920]|nr:hypothetical protein H632_c583p0 [Helicosporidium sp. ATCC 50920]|eukprot:KDD75629.1 hypothetical protein H632_c583p0 [Helicosporidium sp. ATCC 50920]